jgi:ABC-2 type transport system ATP-binding protein
MGFANRVIIINRGRIVINNTVDELKKGTAQMGRLKLRIFANEQKAKKLFEAIKGSAEAELLPSWEEGMVDFVLLHPADEDPRMAVWKRAKELDIPILEMKQANISLEDMFMQLAGGGTKE